MKIMTWQERMPAPRAAFECGMNCSGDGLVKSPDTDCGDCTPITVRGDPVAAMVDEISDLRAALAATPARPQEPVKDHVIRQVVNDLRDTAIKFHDTQQLRERLRSAIEPLITSPL